MTSIFLPVEIMLIKLRLNDADIFPSKLSRTKYVKVTSIFCPSKLRRTKYAETTSIFYPSKSIEKNTLKWRRYLPILWFRLFDVTFTSVPRQFNMPCQLGISKTKISFVDQRRIYKENLRYRYLSFNLTSFCY